MAPSDNVRLDALALAGIKSSGAPSSSPVAVFNRCSLPSLDNANTGRGAPNEVEPRRLEAGAERLEAPRPRGEGGVSAGTTALWQNGFSEVLRIGKLFSQKILSRSASI